MAGADLRACIPRTAVRPNRRHGGPGLRFALPARLCGEAPPIPDTWWVGALLFLLAFVLGLAIDLRREAGSGFVRLDLMPLQSLLWQAGAIGVMIAGGLIRDLVREMNPPA